MNRNDLAKIVGVSGATISRFFNQPHLLSWQIRDKIQCALTEHPYQPHALAAQLARQNKGKIAILSPNDPDLFTYQRFQAIYYLLLEEVNKIPFTLDVLMNPQSLLDTQQFDAIIHFNEKPLLPPHAKTPRELCLLTNETIPDNATQNYIHLCPTTAGQVLANLFCPASTATPLVLMPVTYPKSSLWNTVEHFKNTLKEYKIVPNPMHFIDACNSFESAMEATASAFALGLDFHSIITFNQEAALGAVSASKAEGFTYPFDMQIVHYGHPKEYYAIEHQITCLSDPLSLIIENILKFINGTAIRQQLAPILIEGQTY